LILHRHDRIREAPALAHEQIQVAEIGVDLWPCDGQRRAFQLPASYARFAGACDPDLSLGYCYGTIPGHLLSGEAVFDEGWLWSLHRHPHGLVWRQMSASAAADLQRVAVLEPDLTGGVVYVVPSEREDGLLEYPIHHPLDKFLFNTLLAQGRGLTLHACGVIDRGQGLLFVGESGAGKSTMAELWHGWPEVTLLSDERTIVRPWSQGWRIYGTPWYGTAGHFSSASAPLGAILFLQQGGSNRLAEVQPAEAVHRLLGCGYLPLWDRAGIEFALQCLDQVAQAVPCYELTFKAEGSVVDFVRRLW